VAEVALSALLLVAAGLLVRSYGGLQRVDPGFRPGVLTLTLSLPEYRYADAPQRLQFAERALLTITQVPGVRSAGFVNVLPFSTYDRGTRMTVEGAPPPEPGRRPSVSYRVASPGYLETLGIPVVEGRGFDGRDAADGPPVALVNRALVRRYLGGEPSVGRRVRLGPEDAPWATIVGVVGDVHHAQLSRTPDPEVYVPLAQAPPVLLMLAVRTDGRPEEQAASVRAAIQAVDPAQPVYHVKTMGQLVSDSLLAQTTSAALMTLFSALALALAAVGVYGVVAYGVSQQTREFGLRIALGATPRDVLALVLRQGLRLVGLGVLLGAVSALAATRLMGGILYGVGPADPRTYLGVVSLLTATGFVAASVPAWRASRVTPVEALRVD
jgi:putative ABC transport system permease protein